MRGMPYDTPLTEGENRRLSEVIIEDWVYQTIETLSALMAKYVDRVRDI
jgi:hypothetical protein